jgi:hypothetical protein
VAELRIGGTGVLFVERIEGVVVNAGPVEVAPRVGGRPVVIQAMSKQSVNTKIVHRTGALMLFSFIVADLLEIECFRFCLPGGRRRWCGLHFTKLYQAYIKGA